MSSWWHVCTLWFCLRDLASITQQFTISSPPQAHMMNICKPPQSWPRWLATREGAKLYKLSGSSLRSSSSSNLLLWRLSAILGGGDVGKEDKSWHTSEIYLASLRGMWWSSESQGHCQSAWHTVKHTHTHTHALHLPVTVAKFVWSSVLWCSFHLCHMVSVYHGNPRVLPQAKPTCASSGELEWESFQLPGLMFKKMINRMWAGEVPRWDVLAWTPVTWGGELLLMTLILMMPSPSSSPTSLSLSSASGGGAQSPRWLGTLIPLLPWQEAGLQPSDPPPSPQPRWPFLSSCCLTGKKEGCGLPSAGTARSLSPPQPDKRNQIIDSRFVSLCLDFFLFNPVYISSVIIWFFFHFLCLCLCFPLPLWEQLNAANRSISVVFSNYLTYF